jgi:hypothetical protein
VSLKKVLPVDKTTALCLLVYNFLYIYFSSASFKKVLRVDKTTPLHAVSSFSRVLLGRALTGDPFYAVIAAKEE